MYSGDVHGTTAPGVAKIAFGLCDLVRVVRECIVYAAAVQVKVFAIVDFMEIPEHSMCHPG